MRVLLTYQNNMCITLKSQLLHLQLDFITLKSSDGLAALLVPFDGFCKMAGGNGVCREADDRFLTAGSVSSEFYTPLMRSRNPETKIMSSLSQAKNILQ